MIIYAYQRTKRHYFSKKIIIIAIVSINSKS